MGSFKWNKNQENAIFANKGSVLVSAAAGSGKTAVLVQRVIETITSKDNPIPIDRMLIVTFTRAARAEMLTRVEKALNEMLSKDPYNSHLLTQKRLLYNAKITTIDGFCTDFVRQYFHKLDIRQDFSIADEKELNILKTQALDNTIEFFYNEDSEDFKNLINAICTYRSDARLRENILKLHNFLTSIPFEKRWMQEKLDLYDTSKTDVKDSPFVSYIMNNGKSCIDYCLELHRKAVDIVEENSSYLQDGHYDKLKALLNDDENELLLIKRKINDNDWDGIVNLISLLKWATLPRFKDETGTKESIKMLRDNYKAEIKSAFNCFNITLEDLKSDTDNLYPLIKTLFSCVEKFISEFTLLKSEKNLLDFADIENYMIKLLCIETEKGIEYSDTAKEISAEFDCIMVDEFQDINQVQNLIFKAISKDENNLFMVGDVKQSIYGFRQANPEIFTSYKEKYNLYDSQNPTYPAKIILDENFRSRNCVLNACNFVFDKIMSPQVGGIVYNQEEILNCGNKNYTYNEKDATEILYFKTLSDDEENEETKVEIEARNVAKKIISLVYDEKYQVQAKTGLRDVQLSDIAILLRTSKGMGKKASIYTEILSQYGISAIASEKKSLFDTTEIKILLNLLRIIDNPMQDIPLLSVLISTIGNFTLDDLAEIRINYPKDNLYTALIKHQENSAKTKDFLELLSKFRTASVTTSVDRLIGIILEYTGFDSVITALNKEIPKNIYLLQKYARDYSANGYVSLSSFINLIDKIIENGMTLDGSAADGGEVINAVKVMSIHSSKGLEFPICFICDTSTQFNVKDANEDMVINADAGVGIRYKNDFVKYDTIHRKAVSMMVKNSFISEEMRILYVAMTRAKERLIITSGHKDIEKYICGISAKLTSENISPYVVSNFKSFSDWITACALVNPYGEVLRNIADSSLDIKDNSAISPWKIEIYNDEFQVDMSLVTESSVKEKDVVAKDIDFEKLFSQRMSFSYNYDYLTTLPQVISASTLTHKDNNIFEKVLKKPAFLSDDKPKGTERGTALHLFMEKSDLKLAKVDAKTEAQRLVSKGLLAEAQFELLDFEKITEFFNSELIERLLRADDYFREHKFTIKIDGKDYDENIPKEFSHNKIVMIGAVDLIFQENDELVIIDYKTDRVKNMEVLKENYSKQLELYKIAVEQSFDKKVKEMYIYSLHLNQQIEV